MSTSVPTPFCLAGNLEGLGSTEVLLDCSSVAIPLRPKGFEHVKVLN
jgi:hypothetical protein